MKLTKYNRKRISECTGKWMKECAERLTDNQCGCCHIAYGDDGKDDYCILMGWHDCGAKHETGPGDDGYRIAWVIGRQSIYSVMQADLDTDFELPYNQETGDVDDTLCVLDPLPETERGWEAVATLVRKEARRVWREWAED